MKKKTVVISILGTVLDAGGGARRWSRWRPTVSICQQQELLVDRLELLHQPRFDRLAAQVEADIEQVSPETVLRSIHIDFEDPWDFEQVFAALLDFSRSYEFRPEEERYLVHITTGTHVAQICLFLLTESRHLPAKLLQTSPPTKEQKLQGSSGTYQIIDLDLSRYDQLATRFQQEQREGLSFLKSGIDTQNRAFNELIERIERVVIVSRDPILITGPTGAGKSLLARRIYALRRSRRQVTGELVEVNCATLRGDGAMSALFGHAKGAFTGAVSERAGLLRQADGGVLFLDEIGELGDDEQAMLLRAIEEGTFFPMGSDREVSSDFQLIAGTNRDLHQWVREGRFREDLLARINLWTFRLPALAERPEDIEPNLRYELDRASERLQKKVTINREARDRFLTFAVGPEGRWRGNFRDFSAAVIRMATLAPGGRIDVPSVDEELARLRDDWHAASDPRPEDPSAPAGSALAARAEDVALLRGVLGAEATSELDLFDLVQLAEVVRVCQRSETLSKAGRRLFNRSRERRRSTNDADRLRKYLARFDLDYQALRDAQSST
jgi:transcriptional regulatory protein RtcR